MTSLIQPHGGSLFNCYLSESDAENAKSAAKDYLSWNLTERQLCDLELILNGGFSPLEGFLSKADYEAVLNDMHLSNGVLWIMPITLDVDEEFASTISSVASTKR